MAGQYDPFNPGPTDYTTPPDPGIAGHINSFLGDPKAMSALLSMGLALTQPPSFGDTGFSQIGRAVGAGGQALRNIDTEEEAKRKLDIAQQTADAKSETAAAHSDAAGARSNAAADRLAFQRDKQTQDQQNRDLTSRIKLSGLYQQYVQNTRTRNAKGAADVEKAKLLNPNATFTPEEPQDFNTWLGANPLIKDMGLVPASGAAPTGPVETTPPDPGVTPAIPPIGQRVPGSTRAWSARLGRWVTWNGSGWD